MKIRDYCQKYNAYCCCQVAKLCLIVCNPMDHNMPGFSVLHYFPEFAQIHVHWVVDSISVYHPLPLSSIMLGGLGDNSKRALQPHLDNLSELSHAESGLPLWFSWWRICLQCGRPGFDPWVRKISWRRERLPTPVFWPGEFHGLYSQWGRKESDTTEWLSLHMQKVYIW